MGEAAELGLVGVAEAGLGAGGERREEERRTGGEERRERKKLRNM